MYNEKDKTPRKHTTSPIGKAIEDMLKSFKIEHEYKQAVLINSWEKLVGKDVASQSGKPYIKGSTLYVPITSAPLRQELTMNRSKILARIYAATNERIVEDIVFL